ncbi:PREDICTED: HLA class II histocompatibility antigen, DRB1-1 beta chain, partial [Myotis davidii]|uniref:HLA class II histocompatibility antigen, DRB1-1 beta chain n=1 Tax=Myotis davidii TaxID=225400 RepID=UPI0007679011
MDHVGPELPEPPKYTPQEEKWVQKEGGQEQWPPVPTVHFVQQIKFQCHFSNGMERVRYLETYIYNGQEDIRFDSDVGEYRALTELRRPEEKLWSSQKDILERKRGAVDTFCRYNYRVSEGFLVPRQSERRGG